MLCVSALSASSFIMPDECFGYSRNKLHKFLTFCWSCISVINQLDAQNFCFTISLFHASTCFEHMCSKHLEAWNKLIVKQKFCASSWLITEIKKYVAQYTLRHCTNRLTAHIPLYLHAYYSGMSQVVLKLHTHLIQTWKSVPNPTLQLTDSKHTYTLTHNHQF